MNSWYGLTVSFGLRKRSPIHGESYGVKSVLRRIALQHDRRFGITKIVVLAPKNFTALILSAPRRCHPHTCLENEAILRKKRENGAFLFPSCVVPLALAIFCLIGFLHSHGVALFRLYDTPLHSMIMSNIIAAELNSHSSLISSSFCQSTIS